MKQASELGKRAENLKIILRSGEKKIPPVVVFSSNERDELISELGDAQHFLARNARYLQVSLSDVAYNNVKKISDKKNKEER